MKIIVPDKLNIICATAVLFAFTEVPIEAKTAVIVVPILSPNNIGRDPARPKRLAPSGPACDARFWSTAMVAELL